MDLSGKGKRMLNEEIKSKILDSVREKPRSIDELATIIKKNWRTADRYIQKIAETEGNIAIRTFREGTRGALKIVYWMPPEAIHSTEFQERLFRQIEAGRDKKDFSPSEIYQYVSPGKKEAKILTEKAYNSKDNFEEFKEKIMKAKHEIFFFSGNLTFSNIGYHDKKILEVIEELAKKGVRTKILTRVEIPGIDNIKNILAINNKIGKKMVDLRHCFQPLRITVVDDRVAMFKELSDPKDYAKGELKEKIIALYYVYDKKWIEWLKKVFWELFRASISAERRIEDIEKIKFVK
ncbi:MAG: hypothetical protein KJ767_00375 [Nanoarchaeota archaeon]|nr:hypothetical protein [Nanoarchaeota archaeon]